MWTSNIVKAYAWDAHASNDGVLQWFVNALGLHYILQLILDIPNIGGNTLSTSHLGRFLVFTYIWLPFMILPIQASLERLPHSVINASADLGAKPSQTFRHVILPLSIPGVAAGSIFTFCLTLGDYIIPQLVGPPGFFLGNMVYAQQGSIGNMPMAAAFTMVPIILDCHLSSLSKTFGGLSMHSNKRAPWWLTSLAWGGLFFSPFPDYNYWNLRF